MRKMRDRLVLVALGSLCLVAMAGCNLFTKQEAEYTYWEPALSPDGRFLVYESTTPSGLALFSMDLESGEERQLTFNEFPDWSPHWSPDGSRIVFTSRRENNVDIYLLVVSTLETRRLTVDAADDINPHWGGDGLIYFNSNRSGTWEILTIDPDTRVLRRVTSTEAGP